MTIIIRQGDVLLEQVCALPESVALVPPENGRVVLSHGEATGHHHSFALSDRVALFREDGGGGELFLSVTDNAAPLEHQEHAAFWKPDGARYSVRSDADRQVLTEALRQGRVRQTGEPIPAGVYRVVQQEEYHPQAPRDVRD